MNWMDCVLFAIMFVAVGLGLWSGIVVQVANILIIVLGIVAGGHFGGPVGHFFSRFVKNERAAQLAAFLVIFLIVAVGLRLAALLLRAILKKMHFGKVDTILGGGLGAVKGLLICAVIFLTLVHTREGRCHDGMANSCLMPYVGRGVEVVRVWISEENIRKVRDYLQRKGFWIRRSDIPIPGRRARPDGE